MTWKIHYPGADPIIDEILARRFGPAFHKPYVRQDVIECAFWECQERDVCRYDQPAPDDGLPQEQK